MTEFDKRTHIAALTPMLDAKLGPDPDTGSTTRVFEYGKVPGADGNPGTLPRIFVLVGLEERFAQPRQANMTNRSGWRVVLTYVGFTVSEARWAYAQIVAALRQQRITVNGIESTALTLEDGSAEQPDGGRYSGSVTFRYAL